MTDEGNELNRMARELASIRQLMVQVVQFIRDAESEIPEKMRRFMGYMHDVHDVKYMYEELGQPVPQHLLRELERLDDRYRQLLKELHLDGGAFERVRREMATDPENRYDHTRLLIKPKGAENEAG
jgi:septation ring formation regulator EzrA